MSRKRQYAALPYVIKENRVEICLITGRDSGRWIIPKGWPQKGLAPYQLAALEAFEEAGLIGRIAKSPIGHYRYMKQLDGGPKVECEVGVYPLLVETRAVDWPERKQRKVAWVRQKKTAKFVEDQKLLEIILGFEPCSSKKMKAA